MKNIKKLIGSGDKIIPATILSLAAGLLLDSKFPSFFRLDIAGGVERMIVLIVFVAGVVLWFWSVYLIVTIASKNKLITSGPYSLVKHPIYTSVALFVIPFSGFLLGTWLGVVIGLAMYLSVRKYAPEEERVLSKTFGASWEKYKKKVIFPWL